jgi:hypothetical protein
MIISEKIFFCKLADHDKSMREMLTLAYVQIFIRIYKPDENENSARIHG